MVSYFNIDLTIFSFFSADLTLISFNETKILDPFLDLQSLLQLFCTGTFQQFLNIIIIIKHENIIHLTPQGIYDILYQGSFQTILALRCCGGIYIEWRMHIKEQLFFYLSFNFANNSGYRQLLPSFIFISSVVLEAHCIFFNFYIHSSQLNVFLFLH